MRVTLSLPQQPSSVALARHVLDTLLDVINPGPDERIGLALLLTEACANAVRHSEPGSPFDLAITIEGGECVIEVGNDGKPPAGAVFTAGLPDPRTTTGGRGLPLIAALADTAAFVPTEPGRALLRISKHLDGGAMLTGDRQDDGDERRRRQQESPGRSETEGG